MVDIATIIAWFSMERGESPIILLSQDHQIQELKRYCSKLSPNANSSVLCKLFAYMYLPLTFTAISSCLGIDTTHNLGNLLATPSTFCNTALQDRRAKKARIFLGPIMIHYRCDTSSYRQLLGFRNQELGNYIKLTVGSDGDQSIPSAVKQTFPNTIHLHCTRHAKKNIERHLLKTQLLLQDRQNFWI